MVAAEGDEFGVFERGGEGGAVAEFEVGGCHLGECHGVVKGGDGDVTAVEDGGP